ncbi:MAG: ankyrin repeat domain-containing protein [Spirochaetaceae bacterium]|jgi:ankyrin repeat protein|nr:ankyrin repeat domain-containing protein [Spirochaetaceae bacterium]
MKSTVLFRAFIAGFSVFMLVIAGCRSAPVSAPQKPVEASREDVWSLLAKGDSRARNYFLGEVDVHERDSSGRTPLHYAAEMGDTTLAAFFISLGADVDAQDDEEQTPLGISAEKNDPAIAKLLASAGAYIHLPIKSWTSPATLAVEGDGTFLQAILTPATVSSTDPEGRTILHLATIAGNVQAVNAVLAAADSSENVPAKKDRDGNNALDLALLRPDSRDHMEIAEQLILAGAVSDNPLFPYFAPAARSANYNARRSDGLAPLHYAAREGHEGLIAFLIEKRADVNLKNTAGATPLHEAARSGNVWIMQVLLDQGAEVNTQDAKGNTPMHIGIPAGQQVQALGLFLDYGANPNLRDEHGETPLHIIITLNRSPYAAQILLGGGADASIRNIDGKTPLYLAVEENRVEIIPLLLVYGSDVFAADNSGVTPFDRAMQDKGFALDALITDETVHQSDNAGNTMLHAAVKNRGDPSIISLILDQRALVNARNKEGETALHIAVRTNQQESGEFLISRGADIFAANSAGESPLYLALVSPGGRRQWMFNPRTVIARDGLGNSMLHYAAQWKLDGHIPFIIQQGVSVETPNATGETPLFMAVKNDGSTTVKTLLAAKANLHTRDTFGNSALHAAVRWNARNSALTLIESGIDINAHNLSGNTPLHDAVRLGITDIEAVLLNRGADPEVRNADGNTPFMEAVMAGYTGSMERLTARGADPMTRNIRGDTPLHMAAAMERYDIVNVLLGMGVSIHARNTRDQTPFLIALAVSPRMVSALLTKDRINGSDDFGNSALHIALRAKAPASTVKVILDQGARQTSVDSNGRTPLRLAAELGSWESAKLLSDSGSDPFSTAGDGRTPADIVLARGAEGIYALFSGRAINARDASGNTILHYAARQGSAENILLLLELGANKNLKNIAAESPADIAIRWNHMENVVLLN